MKRNLRSPRQRGQTLWQNRLRTIGDLPGSDLWSGRSCGTRRQQVGAGTACRVSADKRLQVKSTQHYRRPARLRPMVGQVVWYPAAASGCRHSLPRQRGQTPSSEIDSALSETCPAPTYGRAGRVVPGGSKWVQAQPAASARTNALAEPTPHYRRPARLRPMVGQVVWYPAAASGCRLSLRSPSPTRRRNRQSAAWPRWDRARG